MKKKSISASILNLFENAGQFSMREVVEQISDDLGCQPHSIRARIYEGIDKGIFARLSRGIFTVTRRSEEGVDNTCLVLNGDGRDLSFLKDESIDAIVTDHPYNVSSALKGGNRDFAKYELFTYSQQDFDEKARVLKPGSFLVEFLPEESAENHHYLSQIKLMAEEAGFEYYAKVPWVKGSFVANTGRKSKNSEDVLLFTKGKARSLRPDAKKNKAEPDVEHFMSGAAGMLPTAFNIQPPNKKDRIHQAEKPIELLKQIVQFVTIDGEYVLDQFAGSGATGEAALEVGRNCILIEKDMETAKQIEDRLCRVDMQKQKAETDNPVSAQNSEPQVYTRFENVMVSIHGEKKSLGSLMVNAVAEAKEGSFTDPYSGEQLPASELFNLYRGLWIAHFEKGEDASPNYYFDEAVVREYFTDRDVLIQQVKNTRWYKTMRSFFAKKNTLPA